MHIDEEKLLIRLIEKRKIFWEPIVAASLLLMAILGTMVPLYIHSDNKAQKLIDSIRADMKEGREQMQRMREESQQEMRDFHGRLCAIEEKRVSRGQ